MTSPNRTEPSSTHPLRRCVEVLGLLAHGAVFLWIPLLAWGLGERWTREPPPPLTRHTPPLRGSPLPLPVEGGLPLPAPATAPTPTELPGSTVFGSGIPGAEPPNSLPILAVATAGPNLDATDPGPERSPTLALPLRGVAALGGAISLDDLQEKPVPIAVRAERLLWSRSADPLTPLPRHWRDEMRAALPEEAQQVEAQVVRVPAPHLRQPEEVPMAINSRGEGWTLVTPASPASRQLVEQWASRQTPPPEGSGRAVVVTLEPIDPPQPDSKPETESGPTMSSLPAQITAP